MNILQTGQGMFNIAEKYVFKEICKMGCIALQEYIQSMDEKLRKERDKKRYRHIGKRTGTIKTVMGEVAYVRAYYRESCTYGEIRYVFLLDKK